MAGCHGGVLALSAYGLLRRREAALRIAAGLLIVALLFNTACSVSWICVRIMGCLR